MMHHLRRTPRLTRWVEVANPNNGDLILEISILLPLDWEPGTWNRISFYKEIQTGLITIAAALSLSRYLAASCDSSRLVMSA